MIQLHKRHTLFFSGCLWVVMGTFLLTKGALYFLAVTKGGIDGTCPISCFTTKLTEYTQDLRLSIAILISIGCVLGFLKGSFIFKKTVDRFLRHLASQSSDFSISLTKVYPIRFFFLIIGMASLGMLFKALPLSFDIKGCIDCSVGFSLLYGSHFYFWAALKKRYAN